MKPNKITLDDIRKHNPYYDPADNLPEDWTGTVLDILDLDNISNGEKLWAVTRFLPDDLLRHFAVWCAREALKLADPDIRSIEACNVAELFADGKASEEELGAAREAARAAAWAAAWAGGAREVAWAATWAASWAGGAMDAARSAMDAAGSARDAAMDARYAAMEAQLDQLKKMILERFGG